MGYSRAGFDEVVGVDETHQRHYCGDAFIQGDALDYALAHGHDFDAIHASPPCQVYSRTRKILEGKGLTPRYEALIERTRIVLQHLDIPWVIENVPGAPLRSPIVLTGPMFGLRVIRARLFESSLALLAPDRPGLRGGTNSHRGFSRGGAYVTVGGHNYNKADGADAMGIDWKLTRDELSQAIPPAYTEFIGRQLLQALHPREGCAQMSTNNKRGRSPCAQHRERQVRAHRSLDLFVGRLRYREGDINHVTCDVLSCAHRRRDRRTRQRPSRTRFSDAAV